MWRITKLVNKGYRAFLGTKCCAQAANWNRNKEQEGGMEIGSSKDCKYKKSTVSQFCFYKNCMYIENNWTTVALVWGSYENTMCILIWKKKGYWLKGKFVLQSIEVFNLNHRICFCITCWRKYIPIIYPELKSILIPNTRKLLFYYNVRKIWYFWRGSCYKVYDL